MRSFEVGEARILNELDLMEFAKEDRISEGIHSNMIFLEVKGKRSHGVFPAFVREIGTDQETGKFAAVVVDVIQRLRGDISVVRVQIHAEELGKTKRIWDLPPSTVLMDTIPLADMEVVQ